MRINVFITPGAFTYNIHKLIKYLLPNAKIGDNYMNKYDIVVFSGGADINPKLYNEENLSSYYNEDRDEYELRVLDKHYGKAKLYGICRGLQFLSATIYGLKLVQDIQPKHNNYHSTHINKFGIYKVNSLHHQGLMYSDNLPFEVLAIHNNIVESFIDYDNKVHSVQFHPEIMDTDEIKCYLNNLRNYLT